MATDWSKRIQPISTVDEKLKLLVYGRSGTGKTTLAASAPGRRLLVDVGDRGARALSSMPDVDVVELATWSEVEELYWHVKQAGKYDCIIVDTVTQMQGLAIKEVAGEDGSLSKSGWGDVSQMMQKAIVDFRNLPMHVVFVAQDRDKQVEESGGDDEGVIAPEVGPAASPSVARMLNAAVDAIVQTFIREREVKQVDEKTKVEQLKLVTEWCIRIGPHARYVTKARVPKGGKLPKTIADPSVEKIQKVLKGQW